MIGYPKPEPRSKSDTKKVCITCKSTHVVNRTYSLCYDHNQERLKGKDWKKDKIKHSKELLASKVVNLSKLNKKPKTVLKKVSKKQSKIKSDYAKTCKMIDLTRPPQCESCGKWHTVAPLSHSHTISVARCKELNRIDLISDENNIVLECFEAPTSSPTACHNRYESGTIQQKMRSLVWNEKLAYIKEYDTESYNKLVLEMENV